jgi:hypothetical protein
VKKEIAVGNTCRTCNRLKEIAGICFDLIYSDSEAGVALADLLYSYM